MCLMNNQPVSYAPCNRCGEFLSNCMPLIINGLIFGECDDFSYCEFCIYYSECATAESHLHINMNNNGKGVVHLESIKL